MGRKKLFLVSLISGLIIFSLCAILFALAHSEIFDFIKFFVGV